MTGGNDDVMTSFVVLAATYIHFFLSKKSYEVRCKMNKTEKFLNLVLDRLVMKQALKPEKIF